MKGRPERSFAVSRHLAVPWCALCPIWAMAGSDSVRHFEIRSQNLSEALKALSAAADEQLLFSADLVADKRSPALSGEYTFSSALLRLLQGSGLTVDRTRSGVALVVRERAPSVPPSASRSSPTGGSRVEAQTVPLTVPGASEVAEPVRLAEVNITSDRDDLAAFDSPVPIASIGSDRIERQAATNVAQALNQDPAFKATTTPTTNGVRAATPGASYADLRGLGSSRTLVLVDGKRFVPQIATMVASYQVDLNQIPLLLVERAEAVMGGASSRWGSDALAGVVNLVLRKDFQGWRTDVQGGASDYGDDQEYRVGMLAGTRLLDGRAHIEGAVDYVRNNGTGDVYTRAWGKPGYQLAGNPCSTLAPPEQWTERGCGTGANDLAQTLILPEVRFANIAPGGLILDTALRGTQFGPGGVPMPFEFGEFAGAGATMQGGDSSNLRNNINTGISMANYVHRLGTYARFSYHLSDRVSAYAESAFSSTAGGGQTLPSRDAGPMVNTIYADNAFLPQSIRGYMLTNGIGSFSLGRVNRDIGYQQMRQDNDTVRMVAGLEGALGNDWHWEGSYVYGSNRYRLSDTPNRIADHYRWAVDAVFDPDDGRIVCRSTLSNPDNGCQPLNLFGEGSPSRSAIDYVTASTWQETEYRQHAVAASLSGQPLHNWAGPISFSAGVAYRSEHQTSRVDPIADAQRYDSTNSRPLDGGFTVKEGYIESVVPLLSGQRWSRALALNGAVRAADYSTGAGTQLPWTVGVKFSPFDELQFRAARSRDIRVPNLFERHSLPLSTTMNVTYRGLMLQVMQDGSGNPLLRPERGETFTAGASYQPRFIQGLHVSADFFRTEVKDVIAQRNLQQIANFCSLGSPQEQALNCPLLTFTDPGNSLSAPLRASAPFENLAEAVRSGIDLSTAYAFPVGAGAVSLNLNGNYVMHYQMDFGTGRVERAGDSLGSPKWRATASLAYERSRGSFTALARYTGDMLYDNTFIEGLHINDNTVPSMTYVDFSARYEATQSLELFGIVRNAFDKAPPYVPTAFSYPTNPVFYDMIGRTYRFGFRYRFGN
jgi:outer membrane receptor protein involved in Fe transport